MSTRIRALQTPHKNRNVSQATELSVRPMPSVARAIVMRET